MNKARVRQQLKDKVVKKERVFPDEACINPDLMPAQRQSVIDILVKYKAAFIFENDELFCTDLVQHSIDTGDAAPIYTAPYSVEYRKLG